MSSDNCKELSPLHSAECLLATRTAKRAVGRSPYNGKREEIIGELLALDRFYTRFTL
jgi:hypothetical protein